MRVIITIANSTVPALAALAMIITGVCACVCMCVRVCACVCACVYMCVCAEKYSVSVSNTDIIETYQSSQLEEVQH